ncbi:putative O-linked N-acetylglucosamine transferase (SPINDLY family) [Skermanella aerolata]|uniref:O-linked N-acetylglucosamine transferase, SPINDLY family protein n=1 Tax=Skermanella aerolata TaxID=393310 RepID=UPI003D244476
MSDLPTTDEHARILLLSSRLAESAAAYRRLIAERPEDFTLYNNMAEALRRLGALREALMALDRADRLLRGHTMVALNRAGLMAELGRPDEAVGVLELLVQASPEDADLRLMLGRLLRGAGDLKGAARSFGVALRLRPEHPETLLAVAGLLQEQGETDDAEGLYRTVLALAPGLAEAPLALGAIALKRGRGAEAVGFYREALKADPAHAGAQLSLGNALQEAARAEEAGGCFRRALAVDRGNATARFRACFANLPIIYRDMDELERARDRYARDLAEMADHYAAAPVAERRAAALAVGGSQPFYLAYQGRDDLALQVIYGDLAGGLMAERYPDFVKPLERRGRGGDGAGGGRPMRVGFAAGHIGRHSAVNVSLRGWADAFDPAKVELFCYHTGGRSDDETERFAGLSREFRRGLGGVEAWAETIRGDSLDALIYGDVGMDPMVARLAALRLAPVQAMSTGHPVTTGLATVDLYLSSALMEPEDGQDHYRERLIRLPNLSYAYRPLDPPVVPLERSDIGLPENAPVYWCCQSLFKYLPSDDELFVRIAQRVPDALFLFIDYMPAPRVALIFRQRLAAAFAKAGLNADRHCRFLPQMDHARFDAVAGLTDVFLDNPSWSGHNTALEALPHGLPVVTLPGPLMRQRHSAGILAMIGLTGTVAGCRDEYVEIAARLGLDRRARSELRRAVRQAAGKAFYDASPVRALETLLEGTGKM